MTDLALVPTDRLQPDLALERPTGWHGKRVLDVVLAAVMLVVCVPLALVVAVAIKLTSRGPVFFRQERVGFGGRRFTVLKFRTMTPCAETVLHANPELLDRYLANDYKLAIADDPRVTRLGRFLRRSSIDELPQFVNVIVGHMSLVGPRPVRPSELTLYDDRREAYLRVRPGVTGLWQVSGRSAVKFPARAEIDEQYSERCSAGLDLGILLRTPGAVFRARGAN